MATAWNEDTRVTTAGGAVRTGHLEVSGAHFATPKRSVSLRSDSEDVAVSVGHDKAVVLQGDVVTFEAEHQRTKLASGGDVSVETAWNGAVEASTRGGSMVMQDAHLIFWR